MSTRSEDYQNFHSSEYSPNRPGQNSALLNTVMYKAGFDTEMKELSAIAVIGSHIGDKDCEEVKDLGFRTKIAVENNAGLAQQCQANYPDFTVLNNSASNFSSPVPVDLFLFTQTYHVVLGNKAGSREIHQNFSTNGTAERPLIMIASYNPNINDPVAKPIIEAIHEILCELPDYKASTTPLLDSKSPNFHPVFHQYLIDPAECKKERGVIKSVTLNDPAAWLKSYSFGSTTFKNDPDLFASVASKLKDFRGITIPFAEDIYYAPLRARALSPLAMDALENLRLEIAAYNAATTEDMRPELMQRYAALAEQFPDELGSVKELQQLQSRQKG
jgi:hypothetical protein